jgi:NADPH oxidase
VSTFLATAGLILVGGFAGLGLFSVYFIRQKAFELFYYTHLLSLLLLGVGAIVHGAATIWVGLAYTIADFVVRFARLRKVTATLTRLPAGVTRIEFPRNDWRYGAGQYVFICLPSLGPQFHPFSLSSSPHTPTVMLHVRALGGWTQNLWDLPPSGIGSTATCTAYVEGPYGALSVDINDDKKYKMVVLISGGVRVQCTVHPFNLSYGNRTGIGITPMQSVASHLVAQHQAGRDLKKVIFIWSVREKEMGEEVCKMTDPD